MHNRSLKVENQYFIHMKAKDVVLSIVDLIIWYFFAYYAVYLVQNPTLANP